MPEQARQLSGNSTSLEARFGAFLIARGILGAPAVLRAEQMARETAEGFEIVLTQLGLLSEADTAQALSAFLDIPVTVEFPQTPLVDAVLSAEFLRKQRVVPLAKKEDVIVVAMARPLDNHVVEAIRFATGLSVLRQVGKLSDVETVLAHLYDDHSVALKSLASAAQEYSVQSVDDDIVKLRDLASEAPVIRLVSALITNAVEAGASDIHIEPETNELRVRYRIDGVLRKIDSPPSALASAVLSRIKVMAKLNIAERRIPQDGRIGIAVRGRDIDIRVATSPTVHGERATLRILDRSQLELDLGKLGYDDDAAARLRKILVRPHGIFLVTGPTGSGKTTTLYAVLRELNRVDTNILTIEDPVEYQLNGISQIQVKPQIGLSFAQALRSFLRQDPDILMVGEIRDLETAEIAVQAALTGHLILSTVHTNDAASTVTRLLDMGVEDYLLASTMNGVVAQRLVRTLCQACREAYAPLPDYIVRLAKEGLALSAGAPLYRASGCEACNGSGYLGRTTIVEILAISDQIRAAMMKSADATTIHALALEGGMQTMRAHGFSKVLAGITSIDEVFRATGRT
jgi:general secretion pathway protein E